LGKVEGRAKQTCIIQGMIGKMKERWKWKNVNKKKVRRRLRNELERATKKAKEYTDIICDKIREFQTSGHYDLMYKGKGSRLERKSGDSKHWHRRL
jgi:hypothetical protein